MDVLCFHVHPSRAVKDRQPPVAGEVDAPIRDDGAACRVRQRRVLALRVGCSPDARIKRGPHKPELPLVRSARAKPDVVFRGCRDGVRGTDSLHSSVSLQWQRPGCWHEHTAHPAQLDRTESGQAASDQHRRSSSEEPRPVMRPYALPVQQGLPGRPHAVHTPFRHIA